GHVPLPQRPEGLRPPRTAGLSVATRRLTEDPLQVFDARPFAPLELGDALVPAERREVHGRTGLRRVPIRVKSDVVLLERFDDVLPAATLEGARLFADDLKGGADAFAGEEIRDV